MKVRKMQKMGSRLLRPMTALNGLQSRQQVQKQRMTIGLRSPRQALSLKNLACMSLPSAQATYLALAGRSVSARRLPESHPFPLQAAVVGPLTSNRQALLIAAAQHLQSCQPRSRSPAVLRRQALLQGMLSCRMPGAFCLSSQRLCPRWLQMKAGGRERESSIGQRRFQQAVCTQRQGCKLPCWVCLGIRAQQQRQVLTPPQPERQLSIHQPSAVQQSTQRAHPLLSVALHQLRGLSIPYTRQCLQLISIGMEAPACPDLDSTLSNVLSPYHLPLSPQRRSPGTRSGLAGASRLQSRALPKQARLAMAARRCQRRSPNQQLLRKCLRSGLSACGILQGLRLQGSQLAPSCPSMGPHRQTSGRRISGLLCMHQCSASLHRPLQPCMIGRRCRAVQGLRRSTHRES